MFTCTATYKVTLRDAPPQEPFSIFSFDYVHLPNYVFSKRKLHAQMAEMASLCKEKAGLTSRRASNDSGFIGELRNIALMTRRDDLNDASLYSVGSWVGAEKFMRREEDPLQFAVLNSGSSLICCGSEFGGVALMHVDGAHSATLGVASTTDSRVRHVRFVNKGPIFDDASPNLEPRASDMIQRDFSGQAQAPDNARPTDANAFSDLSDPEAEQQRSHAVDISTSQSSAAAPPTPASESPSVSDAPSPASHTPTEKHDDVPPPPPLLQAGVVHLVASTYGGVFVLSHTIYRKVAQVVRKEGTTRVCYRGYHYFSTSLQMQRLHFFNVSELPVSVDVPRLWWHRHPNQPAPFDTQEAHRRVPDEATDSHPYFQKPLILFGFRRQRCVVATTNPDFTPQAPINDPRRATYIERELPRSVSGATVAKISPSNAFFIVATDHGSIHVVSPLLHLPVEVDPSDNGEGTAPLSNAPYIVVSAQNHASQPRGPTPPSLSNATLPPQTVFPGHHQQASEPASEHVASENPYEFSNAPPEQGVVGPLPAEAPSTAAAMQRKSQRRYRHVCNAYVEKFFGPAVFNDKVIASWQRNHRDPLCGPEHRDLYFFSMELYRPINISLEDRARNRRYAPIISMDIDGWKATTVDLMGTVLVHDLEHLVLLFTLTMNPSPHHRGCDARQVEEAISAESDVRPIQYKHAVWNNGILIVSPIPITNHTVVADFTGQFFEKPPPSVLTLGNTFPCGPLPDMLCTTQRCLRIRKIHEAKAVRLSETRCLVDNCAHCRAFKWADSQLWLDLNAELLGKLVLRELHRYQQENRVEARTTGAVGSELPAAHIPPQHSGSPADAESAHRQDIPLELIQQPATAFHRFSLSSEVDPADPVLARLQLPISKEAKFLALHRLATAIQLQRHPLLFHYLYIYAPPLVILFICFFVAALSARVDGYITGLYSTVFAPHFLMLPHYYAINWFSYKPMLAHHGGASFFIRFSADVLYLFLFPVVYVIRRDSDVLDRCSWVVLTTTSSHSSLLDTSRTE
jgi:hypothetical protein